VEPFSIAIPLRISALKPDLATWLSGLLAARKSPQELAGAAQRTNRLITVVEGTNLTFLAVAREGAASSVEGF
jgi:hypothetical protein